MLDLSNGIFNYVCSFDNFSIRKLGVSDDNKTPGDMQPDDEVSDDSCNDNAVEEEETIETIYDLDNYDNDKGTRVDQLCTLSLVHNNHCCWSLLWISYVGSHTNRE